MALNTWEDPALISSLQETLHFSLPHWVSEQPLSRADLSRHGMEMSDKTGCDARTSSRTARGRRAGFTSTGF